MASEINHSVSKYFIALIPPPKVQEQAKLLKEEIKARYNASASFNSPAHITLMMPFEFKDAKKPALIGLLGQFADLQKSFVVSQKGFGCFEPRVIFVNVSPDEPLLTMQKRLGLALKELRVFEKNYKNQAYRPHMTIAFRDLRKPQFYEAWDTFKERVFEESWEARAVYLLKRNDKIWEIDQEFPFEG
ncbi:MAG: 2'-5' RNA ligase family protein [Cyclobacteriaceae bacterium]